MRSCYRTKSHGQSEAVAGKRKRRKKRAPLTYWHTSISIFNNMATSSRAPDHCTCDRTYEFTAAHVYAPMPIDTQQSVTCIPIRTRSRNFSSQPFHKSVTHQRNCLLRYTTLHRQISAFAIIVRNFCFQFVASFDSQISYILWA